MAGLSAYMSQTQAVAPQMPTMQAARMPDASGAEATARLGSAIYGVGDQIATYEHNKQVQTANQTFGPELIYRYKRMSELKEKFPEGGTDFLEKMNAEFGQRDADLLAQNPNKVAQAVLSEKLLGLREHLSQQAIQFQAHSNVQSFDNGYNRLLASVDPKVVPFEAAKAASDSFINGSPVSKTYAGARQIVGNQRLAQTYAQEAIQQDPKGVYDLLRSGGDTLERDDLLGIDVPKQAPTWMGDLTSQQKQTLEAHAFSEWHRQQGAVRSGLERTVLDHETRFNMGTFDPNTQTPLTKRDFTSAYEPAEADIRFGQYQAKQQLGADVKSMVNLPEAELAKLEASNFKDLKDAPEGQAPAFADKYQRTVVAAQKVREIRATDPMAAAIRGQQFGVTPLESDKPEFITQLQQRAAASRLIQEQWGVPDRRIFSDEEAKGFATAMNGGTLDHPVSVAGQVRLLQQIKDGLQDPAAYMQAVKQITDKGEPAAAAAGFILGQPYQVPGVTQQLAAARVLQGLEVMRSRKESAPKLNEAKFQDQFKNYFGEALEGMPAGAEAAYKAAKAYIFGAGTHTIDEKGMVSPEVADEAFKATAGEVPNINGSKVAPIYGFPPATMEAMLRDESKKVLSTAGIPRDFNGLQFSVVGPNRYRINNNIGEVILDPKTGRALEVDLSDPKKLQSAASVPNWLFWNREVKAIPNDPHGDGRPALPVKSERPGSDPNDIGNLILLGP